MCEERCFVLGMTNERENADAWDMERRTELMVLSVAIVHRKRRKMNESQKQARAQWKTRIRWWQV